MTHGAPTTLPYLETMDEPVIPHGINVKPKRVKLGRYDWCQTNPAGTTFILRYQAGEYRVEVADDGGVHDLSEKLVAKRFPYTFSADGRELLLGVGGRVVVVDLATYRVETLVEVGGKEIQACGYAGEGVYVLQGKHLIYYARAGTTLSEAWRLGVKPGIESVMDTGGPVLGLVPKAKKRRLVFVYLDEVGFRHLCRIDDIDIVTMWYHEPAGSDLVRVCGRASWVDAYCTYYEIHGAFDQTPGEPETDVLNKGVVDALPESSIDPPFAADGDAPGVEETPNQRRIRELDELPYDQLVNRVYSRFNGLDLGPDSPVVEGFTWKTKPWGGLARTHGRDGALILMAKFMTYLYFEHQHTILRLWKRVAGEWPDDDLVARLCMKVCLQGYFQPENLDALMEPATSRGSFDWVTLARDTTAEPEESLAVRLLRWAAPRRIQWVKEYLAPHLDRYSKGDRARLEPLLAEVDLPPEDAAAGQPSPLAQREELEQILRESTSPEERIGAFTSLGALGEAAGLVGDVLEEARLDWLGLDAAGRGTLSLGGREVQLQLGDDLTVRVLGPDGAPLDDFPQAVEGDAPELVGEGRGVLEGITAAIRGQIEALAGRLERAMVDDLSWPWWRFRAVFLDHPVMTRLARSLVFERMVKGGKTGMLFTVGRDGALRGLTGRAVTTKDTTHIRLAHPARMTDDQRERFAQLVSAEPLEPPVLQLGRPVFSVRRHSLDDVIASADRIDSRALVGAFEREGFVRGPLDEEHGEVVCSYERRIADKWRFQIWHSPLPPRVRQLDPGETTELRSAGFYDDYSRKIDPFEIGAVVYSEAMAILRRIAATSSKTNSPARAGV